MKDKLTTSNAQLAAIYCRVSSERQKDEGTINSQRAELENIARKNGDIVIERYLDDGYSGELLERPALDKLRSDAGKNVFSKVYILSPDRLGRKHHLAAIILEDLEKQGIKVIFSNRPVGESIEDKLLFNIQSVFGDYEKAKILDRFRRGKLYKISHGNVLGNVAPYGYECRKDEKTRRAWYEVNGKEAEIVRLIFNLYASGEYSGLISLRQELYRRNIKNRHGSNKWGQSMVARILGNETYIGTTHWGKYRSIEGPSHNGYRRMKNTARVKRSREEWLSISVPAIIDPKLFAKVEAIRKRNRQLSLAKSKYKYLLKGLLRCGACGSSMYAKSGHGNSYYVCSKKRWAFPGDPVCSNARHFRSEPLDRGVWEEFRRIVLSPTVLSDRLRQKSLDRATVIQGMKTEIDSLNSKISMVQEKRGKIIDAYANGIISMVELRDRTAELDEQLKLFKSRRNALSPQRDNAPDELPEEERLAIFSAQIREMLETDDFELKRRIVRNFVNGIILSHDEGTVSAFLPRSLSCVPMSTASSEREHEYTGYSFEFVLKFHQRSPRGKNSTLLVTTAN